MRQHHPAAAYATPLPLPLPTHAQWYGGVPYDLGTQLQRNLLALDRGAGCVLRLGLSPEVAAALEEAQLFDALRMGVPGAAQDLLRERPRLRALAVGAAAVARTYNALLGGLPPEDRRLCRDRLRRAHRRQR